MTLSRRAHASIDDIMPRIRGVVADRSATQNANIDLSTAENWLLRPQLVEMCKDAISQHLTTKDFSYPRGFAGDNDLLQAYSNLFNTHFGPYKSVEPSQLATAPGAMACIDTLLHNICDPGDGVLVPGPYWNGFDFGFKVRSSVTPVLVSLPDFDSNFDKTLMLGLEKALRTATIPVKALIITNPHNPLAACYPRNLLEECVKFCEKHSLQFISDEIYALSQFPNGEMTSTIPFTSVLSLNLADLEVEASRVHMVWSMSKDLGQSGLRMGVTVTQSNPEMVVGLALAANTQISSLSTIFVTSLLTSPGLPSLLQQNKTMLATAYTRMVTFFKTYAIPYRPASAGLYVWAKMAPNAQTWEDEAATVTELKAAGVLISSGRAYHGPESEKGWARVLFALEMEQLEEAIGRMTTVYASRDSR